MYLSQKYNKLSSNNILSWFFWENSEFSPKFLQYYRAKVQNSNNLAMLELLEKNLKTLLSLLNNQLENKNYIVEDFSIVDISAYGWIKYYLDENILPNFLEGFNNIGNWIILMENRISTKKINEISSNFSKNDETPIKEIIDFYHS